MLKHELILPRLIENTSKTKFSCTRSGKRTKVCQVPVAENVFNTDHQKDVTLNVRARSNKKFCKHS